MAKIASLATQNTLTGGLSYFDYEYAVAKRIVIPWLKRFMKLDGMTVGDFGCHQGGVLQAFRVEAGIGKGYGFDLNQNSIENSPFESNADFSLQVGDILSLDPERYHFDLILIRDVLEHIPDYPSVLKKSAECLNPGGYLFVSFPPYYSPFGGHQQLAANLLKLAPYLHYLPESLFFRVVKLEDNEYMTAADSRGDMESVRRTRLTLGKTDQAIGEAGLSLVQRDTFLLRPEFNVRYGIPALRCNLLGQIPGLREVFSTGVFYLIQRPMALFAVGFLSFAFA